MKIEKINAMEILDSRGNPTVSVNVLLENGIQGVGKVPSGASTGSFEAFELRDENKGRYNGKGVLNAVDNVNKIIAPVIEKIDVLNQNEIDKKMIELDGSTNKSNLGANSILGVSMAVANAASNYLKLPLFRYLGGINAMNLPIPMMNILNGGKHANNNLSIQEFMIVPTGAQTIKKALQISVETYNALKRVLKSKNLLCGIGDEGGFAPMLKNDEQAIQIILEAIEEAGYVPGQDISIALDVASTEMQFEAEKVGEKDKYYFWKTKELKTKEEMINYLQNLCKKYPIISIEDGLSEEDWETWKILTKTIGSMVQLVGDDLFVTNPLRLQRGIENKIANSILIKPNQIGTITETLQTIEKAKKHGYTTIISHRSGETEDAFIADLAVAVNSKFIKCGAPARSDRVAKYNRLLEIENKFI